jgi:hypothetical protein
MCCLSRFSHSFFIHSVVNCSLLIKLTIFVASSKKFLHFIRMGFWNQHLSVNKANVVTSGFLSSPQEWLNC